jgi:hypothetical protein
MRAMTAARHCHKKWHHHHNIHHMFIEALHLQKLRSVLFIGFWNCYCLVVNIIFSDVNASRWQESCIGSGSLKGLSACSKRSKSCGEKLKIEFSGRFGSPCGGNRRVIWRTELATREGGVNGSLQKFFSEEMNTNMLYWGFERGFRSPNRNNKAEDKEWTNLRKVFFSSKVVSYLHEGWGLLL